MIYYISDLHLFHNNILTLTNRPFPNIQEMHDTIIQNWKNKITAKDVVYILGDVGMYHAEEIADILYRLPGRKILITGNHDEHNLKSYKFRRCFAQISPYMRIHDNGRTVILFHYPIEEWDGFYRGFYHLYGHIHNHSQDVYKMDRRYNVSVDITNFTPMTLDELIAKNT